MSNHQPKRCGCCGRKLIIKSAEQAARELTHEQRKALVYTLHHSYSGGWNEYGLPGTRVALQLRGMISWWPGTWPPAITPHGLAVIGVLEAAKT